MYSVAKRFPTLQHLVQVPLLPTELLTHPLFWQAGLMTEKELKRVQELESITSEGGHHVKDNPIKPLQYSPPLDYLGSSPLGPEYPQEGLGRQTDRD